MKLLVPGLLLAVMYPLFAQQNPPAGVAQLVAEGDRLTNDSQYDKALAVYDSALRIARENHDQNGEAAVLYGASHVHELRGNYDQARSALDQCLALREQLGQPEDIGATLNSIGNIEFAKGLHEAALKFYQQALTLREQAGDRGGAAGTLGNIGNVFRAEGDYQQALAYMEQSLEGLTAAGRERNVANTLGNIAQAYGFLGDYSRALEYNSRAFALAQKIGDRQLMAKAFNSGGVIENWRGNYRLALASLEKASALWKETGRPWGEAEVTENIGEVYQSEGNHKLALNYFSQSIEIARKIQNQSLETDGHRNRGTELLALHRAEEAQKEFELGYKLSEITGEKVNMSISLYEMGRAQMELGHGPGAIRYLEQAGEIQTAIGDRRDLADTRAELAAVRLELGDATAALEIARDAADVAASVDRPDALWRARLIEGKALRNLSRNTEAAEAFDRAILTIESLNLHVAGPPTATSAYFVDKQEPYRERMALALAAGDVTGALTFAERSRARALAQILEKGRVDIRKSLTDSEREQERELQNQLVSLNILVSRADGPSALRAQLERKRAEWESFRTRLYAVHAELAVQRDGSQPIGRAEMVKLAARTRALILDYAVTSHATYLFVLNPSGGARVFPIRVTAARLKTLAAEFRQQLASADRGFSRQSQDLFKLLLTPVASELNRYPGVILIPDGPLWDVPFQALQPQAGHFLIEDAAISYAPSLTVLQATLGASPGPNGSTLGLFALGNPVTSSAEDLPEAERQVRELQKLYGENHSRVLTGAAATEESFKADAGKYRVVHVASHAVLDDANPMYSHVLLAANGREDGMLEAREMMDLELHAEMVVLSACDTARGEAQPGEGITGMLWAMFVAGSRTTVASLWRVESSSTSELMIEFHRQWLQNRRDRTALAKASAMRAASRVLIGSGRYSHPFYWAGFIVAGSPE